MSERSYAILGTGALGGFYGGRLQRAGSDVHFLLRSDFEHVRRHGLRIDSVEGDFSLPEVQAYHDVSDMPACDVVAIALKSTQNHLLPALLPGVVKPGGIVLLLQNGLGLEDQVAEIGADATIVGGLCFLCSNKVGPGHIRHLDYGTVALAEYDPQGRARGTTPAMEQVGADFDRAGIPITMVEDLVAARWRKLVWNMPYNGLTVLLDTDTHKIMNRPDWRARAIAVMREVEAGAAACNRPIPGNFVQHMIDHTDAMTPYLPSMKLDVDAGRPMEIEAIFGNPLRAGEEAGASMPLIREIYESLKKLEQDT